MNIFSIPDSDKKAIVQDVLIRLENEMQHIPPISGIQELLYSLREQKCYLGILLSNRQENIIKWLLANNLNFFHDIICIPFQGSKTPYLQTIKKVFFNQQDFFFVSDESKDLTQAKEAGFSPIGVTWGFDALASLEQAKPDAILSTPKELITTCSLLAQDNLRSKL